MAEASKNLEAFRPHELSRLIWAVASQSCRHPRSANWSSDGNWMQLSFLQKSWFKKSCSITNNYYQPSRCLNQTPLKKHQVEPSQKPKYQTYQPRLVSLVIRWCFQTPRLEAKRGGSTTAWLYEAGRACITDGWTSVTGVIWSNNFFSDMYFAGGTILWEIGFWKLNPFYHVRYC